MKILRECAGIKKHWRFGAAMAVYGAVALLLWCGSADFPRSFHMRNFLLWGMIGAAACYLLTGYKNSFWKYWGGVALAYLLPAGIIAWMGSPVSYRELLSNLSASIVYFCVLLPLWQAVGGVERNTIGGNVGSRQQFFSSRMFYSYGRV